MSSNVSVCTLRENDARPMGSWVRHWLPVGRSKLRYKDTCKNALKCAGVLNQWRNTVDNRQEWRQLIYHTCEKVNQKRIDDYERKRESRRRKELQRQ